MDQVGGRLGLRVDPVLHKRLLREAEVRGVSMTFFVSKLLTESLDRLIPADEFTLTRRPRGMDVEATIAAYEGFGCPGCHSDPCHCGMASRQVYDYVDGVR